MKKALLLLLTTTLLTLPTAVLAAPHGGHGAAHTMDHDAMMKDAATVMLPEQTVDGVVATAHLKDVKATMAKMGMKQTHHFMLALKEAKGGKAIEATVAALKVTNPAGRESEAIELVSMDGHAGADIVLGTTGNYRFKVALKLADGRKLQYDFSHLLK